MNDKLMLVERIFLVPGGLPGRPVYRHILFSPSVSDSYCRSGSSFLPQFIIFAASSVFPALGDLMDKFEQLKDKKKEQRLKEVKKHISDIMLTFRRAASWLDDDVI